ncbi:MAG: hypothetical protein E7334_06165 [Clostridiales bacterium]|nr:hypothetical protein [Clostridiales bacterium]
MKRIKNACLLQTIHFQLKEDIVGHEEAVKAVKLEAEHFVKQLNQKRIRFKIVEQTEQNDGSIMMKIKRQYNSYDVGDYLE